MPFRLTFKHAFVWGMGATVGATLTHEVVSSVGTMAKKLFNRTEKDTSSTK